MLTALNDADDVARRAAVSRQRRPRCEGAVADGTVVTEYNDPAMKTYVGVGERVENGW